MAAMQAKSRVEVEMDAPMMYVGSTWEMMMAGRTVMMKMAKTEEENKKGAR